MLHALTDELLGRLPRTRLAQLPTPLHPLRRLSTALGGPEIWIKRDDLTGLGCGGNKVRKLELLVADALRVGARTLVTTGAAQSNHARQTAAAAAAAGLRCVLVLAGHGPGRAKGNLLLDALFGADVRWCGTRAPHEVMSEIVAEEASVGRKAYRMPLGGSTAIGSAGYALAMVEMDLQAAQAGVAFSHIIVPCGSGGTLAGMLAGARAVGYQGQVLGIDVGALSGDLTALVHELANLTAGLLRIRGGVERASVQVAGRFRGSGYGQLEGAGREAIQLLAQLEGLLLDPVYTAKAMAGLIAMIEQGELGEDDRVLFWHTGGAPALYVYGDTLLSPERPSSSA